MAADEWGLRVRAVNRELESRVRDGNLVTRKQLPRILLTGSPVIFPNLKIPLLIEELGGIVAADETCMGERGLSDPAIPIDNSFNGMLRALANRALRPCSCPTFADNGQRIYRLQQMIRDNKIEGVIYHVLRGCLVYDFEYRQIEEELGKLGIPVIRLESDYNEEDVEQLKIRIETHQTEKAARKAAYGKGIVMKRYYIGLDGGSTYLKAALLKDAAVADTIVRNTGIDNGGRCSGRRSSCRGRWRPAECPQR